jgi:hypothetical protein
MPPSEAHLPMATSLLDPPTEPYWEDKGCIVEEEIPPKWKLIDAGENPIAGEDTGTDKGEECSHVAYHLEDEHLELLFDI